MLEQKPEPLPGFHHVVLALGKPLAHVSRMLVFVGNASMLPYCSKHNFLFIRGASDCCTNICRVPTLQTVDQRSGVMLPSAQMGGPGLQGQVERSPHACHVCNP